jgi:hypothetical protein
MDARRHVLSLEGLNRRLPPSAVALILANFVPIYGVLFLGWEAFAVILLFWFENLVIGFYNVLKMVFARPDDIARWVGKVFMVPFFAFHLDNPSVGMFVGALSAAGVTWAAIALFLSHGFSFAWNYVKSGEFRRATIQNLMKQPYARVVVLHVVIIASGFLVLALGMPAVGLVLLVLLKIGVDLNAHLKERARFAGEQGATH